jgi:hypothetical protein
LAINRRAKCKHDVYICKIDIHHMLVQTLGPRNINTILAVDDGCESDPSSPSVCFSFYYACRTSSLG